MSLFKHTAQGLAGRSTIGNRKKKKKKKERKPPPQHDSVKA